MENGPKSADAILPIDLLSFAIGAARIADGHFENSAAAFGQFDGQFGFDVERGARQRNAFEQFRAHHFVASLHVGKFNVADEIA